MDRPSAIYESEKQLKALADVLEGKEYKNTGATNGESKWLKYIAEQIEKNGAGGSSVQADWNQNNETADDYIKNKPKLIGQAGTGDFSVVFNNDPEFSLIDNKASGTRSHAEGRQTTASGKYSHSEGYATEATAESSHAEGSSTHASGLYSHSEGWMAGASGRSSHAENHLTKAEGESSHAEGYYTLASSEYQHVQGKCNIKDTANTYAHIVGNGSGDTSRSNAHTLDWKGNAWFAGTVEGTAMIVKSSTSGSSKRFKITVDDTGAIKATEITG